MSNRNNELLQLSPEEIKRVYDLVIIGIAVLYNGVEEMPDSETTERWKKYEENDMILLTRIGDILHHLERSSE